jgi:hypothetical protein
MDSPLGFSLEMDSKNREVARAENAAIFVEA